MVVVVIDLRGRRILVMEELEASSPSARAARARNSCLMEMPPQSMQLHDTIQSEEVRPYLRYPHFTRRSKGYTVNITLPSIARQRRRQRN